jgi:hypothetical protein
MNCQNASSHVARFASDKEVLKRALIRQFYEDAVLRYGRASEQALALWRFLELDRSALTNRQSYPAMQIINSKWTANRAT